MGTVISFEERAVATLRDRLGAAESAKEDLIAFARGHSGATAAIHSAVLALMEADGPDALFRVVTEDWTRILGIDHLVLTLVADGKGFRVESGHVGTVEPRIVDRAIERLDPVTMRIGRLRPPAVRTRRPPRSFRSADPVADARRRFPMACSCWARKMRSASTIGTARNCWDSLERALALCSAGG